jgi:hypothetical protein
MQTRKLSLIVGLAAALTALLPAGPIRADTIDGEWCTTSGKQLSIAGPQIVTPLGNRLQGVYHRHDFSYVVPAPEPEAGQTVQMVLVNEQTVHSRLVASAAPPGQTPDPVLVWVRCTPKVSGLPHAAPAA